MHQLFCVRFSRHVRCVCVVALLARLAVCVYVWCALVSVCVCVRRCRVTVEHSFAGLKRFRILSGVFRGRLRSDENFLHNALKIIIHVCAWVTKISPHRVWAPIDEESVDVVLPAQTHRPVSPARRRGRSAPIPARRASSSRGGRGARGARRGSSRRSSSSILSDNNDRNDDEEENDDVVINNVLNNNSSSSSSSINNINNAYDSGNVFSAFQVDDVVRVWSEQQRSFLGGLIVGTDRRDGSFLINFFNDNSELENVHPSQIEHAL